MSKRKGLKRLNHYALVSFIILILLVFAAMEGVKYVERSFRPAILSAVELKGDILATDAINKAIMGKIAQGVLYQDLIKIEQDREGHIIMAQLNAMEVSRLMAELTIATQEALCRIQEEHFNLSLGEVFDNYLLAAYGPEIPVRLMPLGRVNTILNDSFEEAGINQTRHKIYLNVFTEIRVIIPFISTEVEVITTVPIADAVYIGDVPDTVVNLGLPLQIKGHSKSKILYVIAPHLIVT